MDMLQDQVGNFRGTDRHGFAVDYQFFNPRGGVYWQLPERVAGGTLGLYGHVGKTQLEPSLYDLYDTWLGPAKQRLDAQDLRSRPVLTADGMTVDLFEMADYVLERVARHNHGPTSDDQTLIVAEIK